MALDGTTLNPTLTGQSAFITWWFEPEQNRKKQNIKLLWALNLLALSIPHICLILCLFLFVNLSFYYWQCLSWLSSSKMSLEKQ